MSSPVAAMPAIRQTEWMEWCQGAQVPSGGGGHRDGGRWSPEALHFVDLWQRHEHVKLRPTLRHSVHLTWVRRWSRMLAVLRQILRPLPHLPTCRRLARHGRAFAGLGGLVPGLPRGVRLRRAWEVLPSDQGHFKERASVFSAVKKKQFETTSQASVARGGSIEGSCEFSIFWFNRDGVGASCQVRISVDVPVDRGRQETPPSEWRSHTMKVQIKKWCGDSFSRCTGGVFVPSGLASHLDLGSRIRRTQ